MSKKTAFDRTPLFTLLLIRHGQTDYNLEHRFYGRIDTPVNALGIEQAKSLAVELKSRPIDVIYSSPAQRAQMTAQPVAETHSLPLLTDDRLWEMDFGRWEGLTFIEAQELDQASWDSWRAGDLADAPHGGETYEQVGDRALEWLDSVRGNYTSGETVAVFAHGALLQCLLCRLLNTEMRQVWPYRFGNTTVAEVAMFRSMSVLVGLG